MATLYLIRHAEPTLTGVLLGQLNPELSPAGLAQAASLQDLVVQVVWSSPLLRARQTATFLNRPTIELPDLREIHQGDWTGKPWTEIEAVWPQQAALKLNDWLNIPAPGGETWATFLARVTRAWHHIRTGPFPAAIVAHQGVNAALLHLLENRNPLDFTQHYGEIIQLDVL